MNGTSKSDLLPAPLDPEGNQDFKEGDSGALQKIPTVPSVRFIISDKEGNILGEMGGDSIHLAAMLREYSDRPEGDKLRAVKREGTITGLGQDIYSVPREFVINMKGLFTFLSSSEILNLGVQLPWTATFTFVVSY